MAASKKPRSALIKSIHEADWPKKLQANRELQKRLLHAVNKGKKDKTPGYPKNLNEAILGWYIIYNPHASNVEAGKVAGYGGKDATIKARVSHAKRRISNFLDDMLIERTKAQTSSKTRLDRELAAIAFSDIGDYFHMWVEGEGIDRKVTYRPKTLMEIPEIARRAIKKVTFNKNGDIENFEFYDKTKALDNLMHSLGMKQPEFLAQQVGQLVIEKGSEVIDFSKLTPEQLDDFRFTMAKVVPSLVTNGAIIEGNTEE